LDDLRIFGLCRKEFPQVSHESCQRELLDYASEACMYVYDDITWEQFEQKFSEAFGREMTPDEYRWFHSIWTIVNARKRKKTKGAVA